MRQHLLGYLLKALEPHEERAVEEHLEQQSDARRDLEVLGRSLETLEPARGFYDPPAGLARRTCVEVFAVAATGVRPTDLMPTAVDSSRTSAGGPASATWSLVDYTTAATVFFAAALVFVPVLGRSRVQSQLAGCQNNLRALGQALWVYSTHQGGYFPFISQDGPLAVAGSFAPQLRAAGLGVSTSLLTCPATPSVPAPSVCSVRDLLALAPAALATQQQQLSGSYGYTLGFADASGYHGTRNLSRTHFALVADAPDTHLPEPSSVNHGVCGGQNVLYEDGHLQFLKSCSSAGGDHVFLNDAGAIAPGLHVDDAVVAPSDASPLMPAILSR